MPDIVILNMWRQSRPHIHGGRGYRYTADWQIEVAGGLHHEIKEHTPEHLAAQLELTSEACGEYIKLYQIHSATPESGVLQV